MPLYEYACGDCGRKTEVIQRVGEKPLRICPHCGGKLKKAISAPAVHFKGSGWYVTDYARAKKEEKKAASSDSEKSSGESKESASKKRETKETAKKSSESGTEKS